MEREKTIHLEKPNTLSAFLNEEERQTVVSLKITGVIGLKDIDVLDDMCIAWGEYDDYDNFIPDYEESPALRILDLGDATFVDGDCLPDFGFHPLIETLILPHGAQTICNDYDSCLSESDTLRTLIIPEGVKSIGGFMLCPHLTNLILPEGLEDIRGHAFSGCEDITSIHIPASVKSLEGSSFAGCQLKAYEIDEDNPYYTVVDGVVFSKDLSTLVAFPSAYPKKHYNVPDTTLTIGSHAFSDAQIESIDLPDGLSEIEDWAFDFCTIQSINLPESVKKLGRGAFRCCRHLEHITLSSGLTEIPTQAFSSCTKLKIIDVPSSVRRLYYSAVAWCDGLEQLILHDGLEEIVDEGPMLGCSGNLREVILPKTLKKIQGGMFNYSPFIKAYQLDSGNPYFCVIEGALYSKDGKILYAVPDPERRDFIVAEGTEEIAEKAFFNLSKLREVILPNSLLTIGDRVFQGCSQLRCLRLPANVARIGAYFLLSCEKIETVVMEGTVPPEMTGHVKDDMWDFKDVKLLVPKESYTLYKKAPGWKCFIIKEQ